jgi:arylsulfatase A-like enzyme
MSILTGRHPVTTNARYNLMPRRLVHEGVTLGDALRAHGYRATYATDEVRYANFDETFGFDQLITPPVGAIDFLLGYGGDMPLVNLVALSPAGRILFPSNHANRAASITYRQQDFVRRLDREIAVDGPAFLAIHLTTTHWPYSWAGMPTPTTPQAYRVAYGEAVPAVDRQFADVLQLLADKGVLDNAVVVLLSDHGEALGADNDSIIRQIGTSRDIWDSLWGHGTSVLSPNQYHVLLAIRAFGRASLPGPQRNYDWPVSLEDLRPTLEEIATGTAPAGVDGISLVPYMSEPSRAASLASRIRFTETDLNTQSILNGDYKATDVVNEASIYYEVDPDSGWVQLRQSTIPELISHKQRAALTSDFLLAAVPSRSADGLHYIFADRRKELQRPLEGDGTIFAIPEARRLRDALQARFPGELPPSS